MAPEVPTWHRVGGEWVWGTSASILQAEKAADEAIAALREQFDELAAESRKRSAERVRGSIRRNLDL